MTDHAFLLAAIAATRLSVGAFARKVLTRDRRTVQRWLSEGEPLTLPNEVRHKCCRIVERDAVERARRRAAELRVNPLTYTPREP